MHSVSRKLEHMARQQKFTKEQLVLALQKAGGDLTRAAVELQVAPSTVYRAMARHGVTVRESREVIAA